MKLKSITLKAFIILFSAFIVISAFSFTTNKVLDDFWSKLGIDQQQGTENIKESFLRGYFYFYGAKSAKNITTGNRAAVATDLLNYTKQFVNSESFKKEYEKFRQSMKPSESTVTARTKEEIREDLIAQTEKSIRETEENMKKLSPEMQKSIGPVLKTLKEQLVEYKRPDNELIGLMAESEKMSKDNDANRNKENLKKWEEEYPANFKKIISERLQKYLELEKTVDFSADLVEKNGKMRFVKSEYEYKPADWKLIFRAGKEVADVTKAFAEQWLKEMN